MTRLFLIAVLLFITSQVKAVTLENIATPFSVRADDAATESAWPTGTELPGVKWRDIAVRKDGRGKYVRIGTIRLHRHGTATIFLSGTEKSVSEIDISIGEEEGNIFEQDQFTEVLRAQFKNRTKIELLQKCPIGKISGLATYRVTLEGRKPIYVAVMTDSGGSSPKSRSSSFEFSQKHENHWRCDP